ncbi:MAG: signal peptide peptidase SppA, partial [Nitrospirae bacterium]|nr:signal peptide peptidase SppA [Nitrospirota bacterium]
MRAILKTLSEALSLLWRSLDQARRLFVNVLFLLLMVGLLSWLLASDKPEVPDSTALVIEPVGGLVEELYGTPDERALLKLMGRHRPESLVRSIREAIRAAGEDDRVKALYLDLNRLGGASLTTLQTLRGDIEAFKATGRPVLAAADFLTQSRYYLAATADEVMVHPMGMVLLPGFGSYRNYYKEALDRLEVDWNVFRVGEFKSAVEPFLRGDMSPEARQNRQQWLDELWKEYRTDVAGARGLSPEAIAAYSNSFHLKLADHSGQAAALAEAEGLVDRLATRDEVQDRLIELVGENEETHSYHRIDYLSYLEAVGRPSAKSRNVVAVVVAKGAIYNGSRPPGSVGGDSTAELIRRARNSDDVKALVLRVDSPGGSAFASEIIRRQLELTRDSGKPVVVSMGSVAASGGYWIAMSADQIWAHPTTITGSIGIFAMAPTFQRTLGRLGIANDGVGTGPFAGTLRPERTLPDEAKAALQSTIRAGYEDFIGRVAEERGMTVQQVDQVARGVTGGGLYQAAGGCGLERAGRHGRCFEGPAMLRGTNF